MVGQLGNFQRRGRRSFVRLDDDGVARNQSWPHLAAHKPSGIVPRRQRNDHAMGHALDPDLLVRIVRRNDISGDPARFLGRVGQIKCRPLDLAARLMQGLALFGDDTTRKPLAVFKNKAAEIFQQLPAGGGRHSLPCRLGLIGSRDCPVGIVGIAARNRCNHLPRGRIFNLDPFFQVGLNPTAADVIAVAVSAFDKIF